MRIRNLLVGALLAFGVLATFLVGGRIFSASPVVATVEAESMQMPPNSWTILNDPLASGGQSVRLTNKNINADINLPAGATSLAVVAKGDFCANSWPRFTVNVDGTALSSQYATSTQLSEYQVNSALPPGTHNVRLTFNNAGTGSGCTRALYLDKVTFYGPDAPVAPTLNLTADFTSLPYGGGTNLNWTTTDADSCLAADGWSGAKPASGTFATGSLTTSQTYSLTCTGPGGSVSQTLNITVAPPVAPTINFTANPPAVIVGSSSTLNWSSTDADTCEASGNWTGSKTTSGSEPTGSLTENQTYILTCTGIGGQASLAVTVNVTAPPAPVLSLTVDSTSIPYGSNTNLNWTASNADSCTADGSWSGNQPTSGSYNTGNLTGNQTYSLACTGVGGAVTQSVSLEVGAPPLPIIAFLADPAAVVIGSSSTLNWSATVSDSCEASGAWSGSRPTSGSELTSNLTTDQTYVLTCTGPGGQASLSVTVTAVPPPMPTLNLTADFTSLPYGGGTNLNWTTTDADSCLAADGWSGAKPASGTFATGSLTTSQTYSLTCTGPGGSVSQTLNITVAPPVAPTINFTANPPAVIVGSSSTLNWSSTDADTCEASGNWTGSKTTSGSEPTGSLTENQTYILTCTGIGGQASLAVTITAVPASTCNSATYSSATSTVTFNFNRQYVCGQFANGDWFVVPDTPGGAVTITSITPNTTGSGSSLRNGVDVNPSVTSGNSQRWDGRLGSTQSSIVSFPYSATANQSIVKYVSRSSCSGSCGQFAAVLTVLPSLPASPSTTFRPPYFGTYKPLLSTNNLQTQNLLRLSSTPVAPNKISRDLAVARTSHLRLEHSPSATNGGGGMEPVDAFPSEGTSWGGDALKKDTELALWLNLDNACTTPPCSAQQDIDAKRPILVGYTQYGIDLWGATKAGTSQWKGGGGNGAGKLFVQAFATAMLDNQEMKTDLANIPAYNFWETNSYYRGVTSLALWGQYSTHLQNNPDQFESFYWSELLVSNNGTTKDPYGLIDGGSKPGTSYQRSTMMPTKYTALILRMMPSVAAVWPYGNANIIMEYADRVVEVGAWTLPDPCAPKSGTYGVTYGPNGSGGCIAGSGSGRAAEYHGNTKDGAGASRHSAFGDQMWLSYRGLFDPPL